MTLNQWIYFGACAVYIGFFLLFVRFFYWKYYSTKHCWSKRPWLSDEPGPDAPFLSIVIPAREEADVIARTIRHLAALDYPKERYEVIIASDDKEQRDADRIRRDAVAECETALITGDMRATGLGVFARQMLTCLLRQEAACHGVHAYGRKQGTALLNGLGYGETRRVINYCLIDSSLRDRLWSLARMLYPTTQEVVEETISAPGYDRPRVVHVSVPCDFDGFYPGQCVGQDVRSTKGRALNRALSALSPHTEMIGFFDAESRPDPGVLRYVAYRLRSASPPSILQGPVFQVRNYFSINPLCRIAALYQAVSHDWYLPYLFRALPFVGGTNLFISRDLLISSGGFDRDILTEDLEYGVRAYLVWGAWPEYLPYPSSEQTPPTIMAFFRQRMRWGTGHLQVMKKVSGMTDVDPLKRRVLLRRLFLKGQAEWIMYQTATLVPPAMIVLWHLGMVDPSAAPAILRYFLHVITLTYFGFTFYVFRRYSDYIDKNTAPKTALACCMAYLGLLLLPLAAFLFPFPYTAALIRYSMTARPMSWTKTPRTRE
ncbi:MAG: glycosyltransferase family 2 protein [Bacillota bacterium]